MPDTTLHLPPAIEPTLERPERRQLLVRRLVLPLLLRLADRLRLFSFPAEDMQGRRSVALRMWLGTGLSRRRRARAIARLRGFPGFSGSAYLALNPDIGPLVIDPAAHALFRGSCAGRQLFRPERLARALGESVRAVALPEGRDADLDLLRAKLPRIAVFASAQGNVFMQEIADDLASDLAAAGVDVMQHDETEQPRKLSLGIFVAPHEFFVLGRGPEWIREDVFARAVMLNTEQVQTHWFAQALPFLLSARGVIDLSAQTCALLAQTGLPTLQLTLAPRVAGPCLAPGDRRHAMFRVLPVAARRDPDPATPFAARALDVAFFGASTPQRDAFFARNAPFFAAHECFLYCRQPRHGPMRANSDDEVLARLARHVGGHARISLNLHRDAFGYFEWHRIVRLAMTMGSVVVSEPCLPHPGFRPGTHYFEAPSRLIPELLEWLLHTEDGRDAAERVRLAALHRLDETFAAPHTAARALAFLADAMAER